MRSAKRSAVIGLLCVTAASGACPAQALLSPAPPLPTVDRWVQLNGVADLEHLRATNFNHYLRAQKIIAAANEICQPGAAQPAPTRFNADAVNCRSMFWMTSLPPKKLLTFRLDDVGYLALVSVTVVGDKFIDGPGRGIPVQAPGPNR